MNAKLLKTNRAYGWYLGGAIYTAIFVLFSILAMLHFPGNKFLYMGFNLISFILIPLAVWGEFSYFYFFLACFFVLGFWFKATLLFFINYPLVEPIGLFSNTPQAWNKVIFISTIGLAGFAMSKLLLDVIKKQASQKFASNQQDIFIPQWYEKSAVYIWIISFLGAIVLSYCNYHFNLYRTGVIPPTFPFKLGLIVPAMINTGFSFWFAFLLWIDLHRNKGPLYRIMIIIFSSMCLSASLLSRGLYIYQTSHYLISLIKNHVKLPHFRKTFYIYILLLIFGLGLNYKMVMLQRDALYPNVTAIRLAAPQLKLAANPSVPTSAVLTPDISSSSVRKYSSSGQGNIFLKLATERWLGLEGIMAVSSWPQLNKENFYNGWTQRLAKGTANPYPAISQALYFHSNYPEKDKFFFTSLPGVMGMLYYSGSVWIVFFGILIIPFFYMLLESIIQKGLNPFVCSFFGLYTTSLVSMLGDGHVLLAQTVEILFMVTILYLINRFVFRK